jgi:hypothetical protein
MDFSVWLESNLNDLYKSTVEAFPATTLRQHAIDPIKIVKLSIIPYKGMNVVYFKGTAHNEHRVYNPIILFKEVDFDSFNSIQITADDGLIYNIKQLSPVENNITVRCNCKDFHWRFKHYDFVDHSLYGKNRKKYEGNYPANPKELPGMCKHLIKLTQALRDSGLLVS